MFSHVALTPQKYAICWFMFALISGLTAATSADPALSYDILYDQAVEAYLEENWDECIVKMNEALEDYHFYRDATVSCRLKCQKETADLYEKSVAPYHLTDMKFMERMIKQTLCLLKCKKGVLKNRAEIVSKNVIHDFDTLKPYDYLQLCYFKTKDLIKAASSAYTFLVVNPGHEVMQGNLRHYINELNVDPDQTINYEAKPYVEFYIRGSEAYGKQDFERSANYMELSLDEYLQADSECRALCEGPFDQGWFPDFISSIANHYTFTLRCKQKCAKKLGNLNGEIHQDLMPSHYHYLQFLYYQVGNLAKAFEAVGSYLLFYPEDETMLENKRFYSTLPDVTEAMFQPRPEAVRYFEREREEKSLVQFIENHFQFDEGDISEASADETPRPPPSSANEISD